MCIRLSYSLVINAPISTKCLNTLDFYEIHFILYIYYTFDIEPAERRKFVDEKTKTTTRPLNTSSDEASASVRDQPEFSALEQSNEDEEEPTTIIDDMPKVNNDSENTTEYNKDDSEAGTLQPAAVESKQNSEPRFIPEEHVDGLLQNKSADMNITTIN